MQANGHCVHAQYNVVLCTIDALSYDVPCRIRYCTNWSGQCGIPSPLRLPDVEPAISRAVTPLRKAICEQTFSLGSVVNDQFELKLQFLKDSCPTHRPRR